MGTEKASRSLFDEISKNGASFLARSVLSKRNCFEIVAN
jgi:hypothetical protein